MLESFEDWKADNDKDNKYAGLGELESFLTKLTCLEIQIANPALVAQQIKLSSEIQRFHIAICYYYYKAKFPKGCNKKLILKLEGVTCLGHWLEKLVKETQYLCIKGNDKSNLDLALVNPNILFLKLEGMENMVETLMDGISDGRHALFQHMESLELSCLPQLQEIWKGPISSNSFKNIKTIKLTELSALKVLWTKSMGDNDDALFPHIECLKLSMLPLLQEIWNGPVSSNSFQNLKKIHIKDLSAVKRLWKCSTSVSLPQLQILKIKGCEMMEQLFQWSQEDENADIDQHYYHLFCQPQKVSFGSLKKVVMDRNPFCRHINIHASFFNQLEELSISKYDGTLSLFTPSIARNLANLRELRIVDCDEMEQVIDDDKAMSGGCLFPELMSLHLENLGKLVSFCKWKCEVELPSLKRVVINGCPNMTPLAARVLDLDVFATDLHNYLEASFNPSCSLHQIPLLSFRGLQDLDISDYKGSMGIFSSSIAENFVSLRQLRIERL